MTIAVIPDIILHQVIRYLWHSSDYGLSFRYKLTLGLIKKSVFKFISKSLLCRGLIELDIEDINTLLDQMKNEYCILKSVESVKFKVDSLPPPLKDASSFQNVLGSLRELKLVTKGDLPNQSGVLFYQNIRIDTLKSLSITSVVYDSLFRNFFFAIENSLSGLSLSEFSVECKQDLNQFLPSLIEFIKTQKELQKLTIISGLERTETKDDNFKELIKTISTMESLHNLTLGYDASIAVYRYSKYITQDEKLLPINLRSLKMTFNIRVIDTHTVEHVDKFTRLVDYVKLNVNLERIQLNLCAGLIASVIPVQSLKRYLTHGPLPMHLDSIERVDFNGTFLKLNQCFQNVISNDFKPAIGKLCISISGQREDVNPLNQHYTETYLANCPTLHTVKVDLCHPEFTFDVKDRLFQAIYKNSNIKSLILYNYDTYLSLSHLWLFDSRNGLSKNSTLEYIVQIAHSRLDLQTAAIQKAIEPHDFKLLTNTLPNHLILKRTPALDPVPLNNIKVKKNKQNCIIN
ncbi:hypothetical protein DLAC_02977 [Tieghemostelium lacteum]|uniref:F-box domain-containing protein n=1 Tax=Tieghemostelium lacteum TaxID=361077 RepID=A0A152A3R9_TIELA|nr:hypothetical protein DLAC_02977 [Tieghemostelium lacteum]|eukprot:KYR00912.1 hypothetical protein DLAC_02977 [Tieghemostelium lacteum]